MLRLHPYTYHRPATLADALALLSEHADAMPIAGGTDLVPNMKHRLFTPSHLVSLGRIPELSGIEVRADGIRIGACESLASVAGHPDVAARFPSLAKACGMVSGPQLRRMGTIGGNVCLDTRCTYYNQTLFWRQSLGFCLKKDGDACHVVKGGTRCVAAHSADTPPMLMVLDARLEIAGPQETRTVPITGFFTSDGVWNRRMERGEILVSIFVPFPERPQRTAFQKLRARESIDFPLVNLAVAAELDDDRRVSNLKMVASALGSYPRQLARAQDAVIGETLTPEVIEVVAEQAYRQCRPLDNITVEPQWRRAMVPVLVRRALREISG